jgi:DNA-binding IclR family transcriptional regulator
VAVGSVVSALAILRHLSTTPPQGVNAIARSLSLNPSTCFNILKTLASEGFLEFDPQTKTYRLTPPSWIARSGAGMATWTAWIREELRTLALQHEGTCGLWQLSGDRLVLLEVADSPLDTRIHLAAGQRLPRFVGAMGRCIAALDELSLEDVTSILSKLRWQDPPAPRTYWNDIRKVRDQGWAIDAGNLIRGVTTVAAGIVNGDDRILFCLSCSLFDGQLRDRDLPKLGNSIAALARQASKRLGT